MGETQNLRNNRVEKYDPIYGRFVRNIKTTDIINLFAKSASGVANTAGWIMTTYETDANHALYPYIFGAHHCGTSSCPQFVMLVNGTTAMAIQTDVNGEGQNLVTDCECPLTRVAPNSTLAIFVPTAVATDTYGAFIVAKREPIVPIVEN